jgi:hypothetical protein
MIVSLLKTHKNISGIDARMFGQKQYEFDHQTACGYVRDKVTHLNELVDCKLCLRELNKN